MIDVDPLTSRLLAAVKRYPPIADMPPVERQEFIPRVIEVGLDNATLEDKQVVDRANRARLRDLRLAGATYDPATNRNL